jgi:hypothetical protein
LEKIFLTADDADFADLTLILLRIFKKSALNQQNQRHRRLPIKTEGKFNNGK